MSKRQLPPDRVSSYFWAESGVLAVITVTGLLYNIGLVAGPWFEGQMTEALARTLAHQRPLLILDDPFSALDRATETEIFAKLRRLAADSVVILISHRLYLFPELDRVIWLENGEAKVGSHEELVGNTPDYAAQFDAQREENSHE